MVYDARAPGQRRVAQELLAESPLEFDQLLRFGVPVDSHVCRILLPAGPDRREEVGSSVRREDVAEEIWQSSAHLRGDLEMAVERLVGGCGDVNRHCTRVR